MPFTTEQIERNPRGYVWTVMSKARARGDLVFADFIDAHFDWIVGPVDENGHAMKEAVSDG